ncbi:unnamed protein product [Fraxinus pennsylvanica]|uniref:Malonyl-CoA:ACP transacylase (MAT) domain-containing protein n=1 Tax=Fraxinus pennsylvanica TaxID=56036 RepID=A0AAD2E3E1_9LAMI|nr:unnamed protein product [Fraxinus pennsylvanica]
MSVAVGSQTTVVDDALFKDYKISRAFLFPGQGAQAVGMGVEAQKVTAAAELYKRANDILGFDLLDVCINGPKEELDSTVLSQVCHHGCNIDIFLVYVDSILIYPEGKSDEL